MGAKASTAAGNQSPRTFSNSSSSDVVSAGNNATSFNFLRAINAVESVPGDSRQRARSMSACPDIDNHSSSVPSSQHHYHHNNNNHHLPPTFHHSQPYDHDVVVVNGFPHVNAGAGAHFDLSSNSPEESNSHDDNNQMHALGIGRVAIATSLPSHIWSLNGFKCPVCSKFILPDEIECHIVMCLTKPRLSYNEDVLSDQKGECVICLEDLNAGDVIARLPCLCIYHKGCIDSWFEVNRSCPEHPSD
ncbi:hypothetical protein PVAND_012907 [Polypedilum vanderplanki]|uniref:E3 ubiquitin-protein ligase ZNRF1 n=1 Tax=Polypedilum vanderplanki TaxID=319348 RepID=A0A9J6CPU4_POLVA|nr:hypothetical protein PVAND_012907 [Polypedilum vanderplanki]